VRRFAIVTLFLAFLIPQGSEASPGFGANLGLRSSPGGQVNRGDFVVPAALRPRVNFWKDIFSKYGRRQVVVHHRHFPQLVFGTLDFREEAESLSPGEYERFREAKIKRTMESIKTHLQRLSSGATPEGQFEQRLVELLQGLPGGHAKYKQLIDEDLIRTQTGIREKHGEAVSRSSRYLPIMEHIFTSEFGLPRELTRLPFIESSFDYLAYSSVGAAGLWQFMPRTARGHGLVVGRFVDERRDPIRATRAAAQYLRAAYARLGNWPLAITSYNHGVGGVASKVAKAGTSDLAAMVEHPSERYFGFASSNFYPEFLAAIEVYEQHRTLFPEVQVEEPLRLVSTVLRAPASVGSVQRVVGIDPETLRRANYALMEPVWNGAAKIPAGYQLRVPLEFRERLSDLESANLRESTTRTPSSASAVYGGIQYKVRRGDTVLGIAKKYKTTVDLLLRLNGLTKGATLRVGQTLVVKAREGTEEPPPLRDLAPSPPVKSKASSKKTTAAVSGAKKKAASKPLASTSSKSVVVRRGESLFSVSKRVGVPLDALRRVNGIAGNKLRAGQTLKVPR
jgi:membrane-bound lytic murein transglycosylase D